MSFLPEIAIVIQPQQAMGPAFFTPRHGHGALPAKTDCSKKQHRCGKNKQIQEVPGNPLIMLVPVAPS
jgi:hypothetical protein